MPSKKKKFNARFPPARIKKIMQTDDDVGKVAAPVPVIISRALELFLESLILKTNETTNSRNARTLTCSHIKQTILSEGKFDFLKDLVANVPDVQVEEEDSHPPRESGQTSGTGKTGKPRGRPRKPRPEGAPPLGRPKKRKTPTSSTDESCENNETRTDEEETDEASEDNEQEDDPEAANASSAVKAEPPEMLELGQSVIPQLSPGMESHGTETGAVKTESFVSESELSVKLEIKCEDSPTAQSSAPECKSTATNTTLVQEHFRKDNSGVDQCLVKSVDIIKQEQKEQSEGKDSLKTQCEQQQLIGSKLSVLPGCDGVKLTVKTETVKQNFPHHIENLIRPDAPKRDNAQMNFALGMNDAHLPKDHDNNIAGKCPPRFSPMQPMDLTLKTQGFPMHLPPQMILPGHRPPCLPLSQPNMVPLEMTQQMQLSVPPPIQTLPNTQIEEDDDYDS